MDLFASQFLDFARSVSASSCLRLAPTPSGYLHAGNALNFTLNWLAARAVKFPASSAKLLLRIDDLDAERKREEYVQDIFDTLEWLDLDWDASPISQSEISRRGFYEELLNRLRAKNLLFACGKSRKDLESFGGKYPEEWRNQNLDLDAPDVAWRVRTPPNFPTPDFVVRRRDGIPAYQIASLADDLREDVTHIIRGLDLEVSTAAQLYLAEALGEDKFLKIKFLHHPLLLDSKGGKLSKSAGADALKSLRVTGTSPQNIFLTVAKWLDLEGDSAKTLSDSLCQKLA